MGQLGGLQLHESEIQMGLPQGNLLSLPKSFQAIQSSDSRRVLSSLWLQPQVRHPAAQRPSPAEIPAHPKRPVYGAKMISALTAIWEAAGYPCSTRGSPLTRRRSDERIGVGVSQREFANPAPFRGTYLLSTYRKDPGFAAASRYLQVQPCAVRMVTCFVSRPLTPLTAQLFRHI